MRGLEIAVAGIGFGERIGIESDDGVEAKTVDGLLIVGSDTTQILLDDSSATNAAVAYGLLSFSDGCADNVKGRGCRLRPGKCCGETDS